MKNEIYLSRDELRNQEVQTLSSEQLLRKVETNIRPSSCRLKSTQQPLLTNIRTYHIDRLEDNTLFCRELCRTLPSTPQGKLDKEQLAREIARQKDFFQSR